MFGKEERKEWVTQFWEGFKQFMKGTSSLRGNHVPWINYPTNVKSIYFRYYVDQHHAKVVIEIQEKDEGIRDLHWEQFGELKKILEGYFGDQLIWQKEAINQANMPCSQIYMELKEVNLYKKEDHQKIYSFLKENIIKLDDFWETYFDIFEELQ
ncbi:MAG: DUF4268 domain-containing protein [Crocinitomicaceae bacterium]|nr:DUF4268 domain-containing protein [Crocinitomicaceae bacterium]